MLEGRESNYYETVRKKKNNELIDVSVMVSPVCDLEGILIGTSIIIRDITKQKERRVFGILANIVERIIKKLEKGVISDAQAKELLDLLDELELAL